MSSYIDILIPVYNEADSVRPLVQRLEHTLNQQKIQHHYFFVDDHSTDETVSILNSLSTKYPITVVSKRGAKGKAFSILEAAQLSTAPYIAMIDADLQYPPEVIPEMLTLAEKNGMVVAQRQKAGGSIVRRFLSKGFKTVFGRVLYGLKCDVQSGLKVFKREVIEHISPKEVSPWTLDIPLLLTARELGFSIAQVDITFEKRANGESKIHFVRSIKEIGWRALSYKLKGKKTFQISAEDQKSMIGAGMIRNGRKFVTHSTLAHTNSALEVITLPQRVFIYLLLIFTLLFFVEQPMGTAKALVAILSFVYFVDVLFNLFLTIKSLHTPPEIAIEPEQLTKIDDSSLPIYTILCPLYKEAHVLPQFLDAISRIDWPKSKLDVILLLESDDEETIAIAKAMQLPKYVSIRIVPDSQPKTKPKACNYGLHFAKGKYLVIYDAEDSPDPLQLKKVFAAFQKLPDSVKCIQAKLNFYNPHQNLLTRFFTAEYSLWFDVVLTGLQSIETTIPLGGTSNHFRTDDLRDLQGWDPFNVTEDCDLGIRLFERGGTTAIINSVTLEEANSSWRNWLRQRSRWIKGYMQTYLVHMRHPLEFAKRQGLHALLFQLVVGGKISFMLINPFMWVLTLSYFLLYAKVGPAIQSLYPSSVFYMAVVSLVFGNFMFIYYYMIGAAKRGHWSIIKWVFLVPLYWLMVSIAAMIALYQLIVKPHYWEKTIHGLHLKKNVTKASKDVSATVAALLEAETKAPVKEQEPYGIYDFAASKIEAIIRLRKKIKPLPVTNLVKKIQGKQQYRGVMLLILANIVANVLNMASNIYAGKVLPFADFGVVNTFNSILYLVSIPTIAFYSTINHRISFLLGKYQDKSVAYFWVQIRRRALFISLILAGLWVALAPYSQTFFNTPTMLPILVFTPLLILNILTAVDRGYIKGKLMFEAVALVAFIEPLARFVATVVIGQLQLGQYLYFSIVFSAVISYIAAYLYARQEKSAFVDQKNFKLPWNFFGLSLLAGLSTIAFFSLDNILVAHYLGAVEAGKYAMLGLVGKMIFFAGNLILTFITPIISHQEGSGQKTKRAFLLMMGATSAICLAGFAALGLVLPHYASLAGDKVLAIAPYLPLYCLGIALFTISQVYVGYHLAKHNYLFPIFAFLFAVFQVAGLAVFHRSLYDVMWIMFATGLINIVGLSILHLFHKQIAAPLANVRDFIDLFAQRSFFGSKAAHPDHYNILFFNWRDTKHLWAGGAEAYIQQVAEHLVEDGHRVTIFCGNDDKNPRNETIHGVQIVRRGGFYTVYFWAFIYYVLRFRQAADIIVDCENGIPFLTPLYSRKPIFLLIHHIHQQVFREHLVFPFSWIANLLESKLMPVLYQNKNIITVSESSKQEIIKIGLGKKQTIDIVNPGVNASSFVKKRKTTHPSLVYIGRLKPYKNVDVAIRAMQQVIKIYPTAELTIAGSGESEKSLRDLVQELKLSRNIKFRKVADAEKAELFAESWIAVQPSMIEGWGITVIEANAAGTPVIASDVKGLCDSIQDHKTGLLVPAKNINKFAEAICSLIANRPRRQLMSKAAVEWAEQFLWSKEAAHFVHVLETKTNFQLQSEHKKVVSAYDYQK